jgi:hypothetical protein
MGIFIVVVGTFIMGLVIGGAINLSILESEYDLVPKKKCKCK